MITVRLEPSRAAGTPWPAPGRARAQRRSDMPFRKDARPSGSAQACSTSPQNRPRAALRLDSRACARPAGSGTARCDSHRRRYTPSTTPAQQRLRIGLAPAQRGRELDEVTSHVLERARQRADSGPPPATGIDAEKSPRPSRVADSATRLQRTHDATGEQQRRRRPRRCSAGTPSTRTAARNRRRRNRFPKPAGAPRAARCLRRSRRRSACSMRTGRARRCGAQTLSARDSAVECSSLNSGSTLSSQFDSRTSRICMPVCSVSDCARLHRNSAARRRGCRRIGHGGMAPCRPSGCQAGASMKRSPWSAWLRAPRSRRRRAGAADEVAPTMTAQASRFSAAAGAAQEQLELLAIAGADQPLQRLPRASDAGGGQRVFAEAPDFLACRNACKLDPRQRLLLGLLAQQADGADGEHEDRGEHEPAERERQRALERRRPGREPPQARQPIAATCRESSINPCAGRPAIPRSVLITSVTIASIASREPRQRLPRRGTRCRGSRPAAAWSWSARGCARRRPRPRRIRPWRGHCRE